MSYRLVVSVMGLCLVGCGGSTQVSDTTSSRASSNLAESMPWPKEALKAARVTPTKEAEPEPEPTKEAEVAPVKAPVVAPAKAPVVAPAKAPVVAPAKVAAAAPTKAAPSPKRDTKSTAIIEDEPLQDFSGVDTSAPVDDETDDGLREVSVEGIEGSMSEFDVRVTLENRAEDFDRCHDRMGGGGGRIVYRIHIEADGGVGRVKTVPIKSRNKKLVSCYTEVVSSSHFPRPHGGYANVKWTTKVGRTSRKKKTNMLYDRPHRWDAPAGKQASR